MIRSARTQHVELAILAPGQDGGRVELAIERGCALALLRQRLRAA
jgi:hypothetical protein